MDEKTSRMDRVKLGSEEEDGTSGGIAVSCQRESQSKKKGMSFVFFIKIVFFIEKRLFLSKVGIVKERIVFIFQAREIVFFFLREKS